MPFRAKFHEQVSRISPWKLPVRERRLNVTLSRSQEYTKSSHHRSPLFPLSRVQCFTVAIAPPTSLSSLGASRTAGNYSHVLIARPSTAKYLSYIFIRMSVARYVRRATDRHDREITAEDRDETQYSTVPRLCRGRGAKNARREERGGESTRVTRPRGEKLSFSELAASDARGGYTPPAMRDDMTWSIVRTDTPIADTLFASAPSSVIRRWPEHVVRSLV